MFEDNGRRTIIMENGMFDMLNTFDTMDDKAVDDPNELYLNIENMKFSFVSLISTGFVELDSMLCGGFAKGELIVMASRPGMGKTSLACNIATYAALKNHRKVAVFSLEMSADAYFNRITLSATQSISRQDLESYLIIDDENYLTASSVKDKCRKMKEDNGLDLVIIDYLQLMSGNGENRRLAITEILRNLNLMAKELQVPVIVLSQLGRSCEHKKDKRSLIWGLTELAFSAEQDADILIFIYRDDSHNENYANHGETELIITKHRAGPTGTVKLFWNADALRFENI